MNTSPTPIFLGNVGKQIYFFQILTHIDDIDNLTLCKINMMSWRNYYKTQNASFEMIGIYFIFPNEVFFLCISDFSHHHLMDEREFFETLIDNRIDHIEQSRDLLISLKNLTKYIPFHKVVNSTDGFIYKSIDDFMDQYS